MTDRENSMSSIIDEAERRGKELEDLDKRNRVRRAKGRKPLPDPQEKADADVRRKVYRKNDPTTVDSKDALKLFDLRKMQMLKGSSEAEYDLDDLEVGEEANFVDPRSADAEAEKAVREAEAARRVQDMKNGRVDHEGTWSESGAKLEGGDATSIVDRERVGKIWEGQGDMEKPDEPHGQDVNRSSQADGAVKHDPVTKKTEVKYPSQSYTQAPQPSGEPFGQPPVKNEIPEGFVKDLYSRLGQSFDAIEHTLSDLQGRVSEIVKASTPKAPPPQQANDGKSEFEAMLAKRTPVVFDVGGTQLTFDAICVFHAPPCITVVSKIGSAKVTPKPGAQLLLSYDMDGRRYNADPVTFLGTRFDLPMFGLSFVGFIRDREADMIDTAAGMPAQTPQETSAQAPEAVYPESV